MDMTNDFDAFKKTFEDAYNLCDSYGRLTDSMIDMAFESLAHYELIDVLNAIKYHVVKNGKKLTIAAIVDIITGDWVSPAEAWALAPKIPANSNREPACMMTKPMINALALAQDFIDAGKMFDAAKAFQEAYKREVEQAKRNGEKEIWLFIKGYGTAQQIDADTRAVIKQAQQRKVALFIETIVNARPALIQLKGKESVFEHAGLPYLHINSQTTVAGLIENSPSEAAREAWRSFKKIQLPPIETKERLSLEREARRKKLAAEKADKLNELKERLLSSGLLKESDAALYTDYDALQEGVLLSELPNIKYMGLK